MQNEIEDEELVLDLNKIFKILGYRKKLIATVFSVCFLFFVLLAFVLPKKYETNADIYVNKANTTNLMEFNPYVLSSISSYGGLSGMLAGNGMSNQLQNELEIMQSPLVMDNVIRENNLRYKKGAKKGEFISTKDFLKKNLSIENKKGSNIISIAYKSKNPLQSYNIVNSIISNYEKINEEINVKKAIKDKKLLAKTLQESNKTLNQKISAMKNSATLPGTAMGGLGMLAALKGHNKAVGGAMSSIQNQMVEGQKSQIGIEAEAEKLKLVKTKYEWSDIVEKMSKDTTNVIILKHPEIKRGFESSEPKLLVNIMLGAILGALLSVIAVIVVENIDKSIAYSTLGEKIIYDVKKNIDDLKLILLANANSNLSLLIFEGFNTECLATLSGISNFKTIKADITPKVIDEISHSDKLVFAAKIGQTPKKIYQQFKTLCKESQKEISVEII